MNSECRLSRYRRRAVCVDAWAVPLWGRAADEPMPAWLVEAIQLDLVRINHLGGLTVTTPRGVVSCGPGDVIVRDSRGEYEFCEASEFNTRYEPLAARHAA